MILVRTMLVHTSAHQYFAACRSVSLCVAAKKEEEKVDTPTKDRLAIVEDTE